MNNGHKYLFSKEKGCMQLPYSEYMVLMGKYQEGIELRRVRAEVLADLAHIIGKKNVPSARPEKTAPPNKASELSPKPSAADSRARPAGAGRRAAQGGSEPAKAAPALKQDIQIHFNKLDASGRLLNVFQQYYTCLNASCGGTVRVTMKDGFCSIWNYDEWEEFAFMDIFKDQLRICLDPRYASSLKAVTACEVPVEFSRRRELFCVAVDHLNKTVLDVLTQAFHDVGQPAS